MITKVIEVTNKKMNWGKFLLIRFDEEWQSWKSQIDSGGFLLRALGWNKDYLWVLDLQTGEGAFFCPSPTGLPSHDLDKHKIWVCPLYEPFLGWLYQQDLTDLGKLPAVLDLEDAPFDFRGYRRNGPDPAGESGFCRDSATNGVIEFLSDESNQQVVDGLKAVFQNYPKLNRGLTVRCTVLGQFGTILLEPGAKMGLMVRLIELGISLVDWDRVITELKLDQSLVG